MGAGEGILSIVIGGLGRGDSAYFSQLNCIFIHVHHGANEAANALAREGSVVYLFIFLMSLCFVLL